MHHSHRNPRRLPVALALLGTAALAMVLAGCSTTAPSAAASATAGQVALSAVDDVFTGASAVDGTDLAPASVLASAVSGTTTQSVQPFLVVRRTDMRRQRRLVSLVFDTQPDPTKAEAEVWVKITGTAQIWQVYPASGSPRTLLGSKPIDLEGTLTLDLAKGADGWRLVAVASDGLSQGAYAASVGSVSFAPDPLRVGRSDNVVTVALSEPDTSDAFLVVARGRYMAPHGVLADDGVPPDAVAGDDVYSGFVWVGSSPRVGTHLAFITALDYTRTIDMSQTAGSFDEPYTFTLQPVLVNLAAGD